MAQLEGDTVGIAMGFSSGSLFFTPGTSAVVGPNVEFMLEQPNGALFSFDFSGNILVITSLSGAGNVIGQASPIIFSSIDWPGNPSFYISGAYVYSTSAIVSQAGVNFTAHTLTVNLCCGVWNPGSSATIELYPDSEVVAATAETWGTIKALFR